LIAVQDSTAKQRPSLLARAKLPGWYEDVLVAVAAFFLTLHAEWRLIPNPLTFQTDSMIHEYWMRRFQDGGLFGDPLTEALLETGYSPPAFRSLYWLASQVVDPVFFGELLPLVLQPLAVWLVFRIVRAQLDWRPAAWIAAALFLVPWDVHRFSGGHPRAFAQPVVLATVLLLLNRRHRVAALVPAMGLLLYPPAGVVALVIVFLGAFDRHARLFVNGERARWAGISALAAGAAVVLTRLTTGSQAILGESEARLYPEFGERGQMHFFQSSALDFLSQNYSGFFLHDSGSILAVAALLLLVVRPRNANLLRWEVWCMPIAALLLFGAAHALLFRLYLPHRYTYALLPFFCIAIAVFLRPTFQALTVRSRGWLAAAPALALAVALLALTVFPLGPRLSLSGFGDWLGDGAPYLGIGLAVGTLAAAVVWSQTAGGRAVRAAAAAGAAAVSAGSLLVAEVAFAGGARSPGASACREANLYSHLRTLPNETIIAADPFDSNCIPIAARRSVVISRKLYQPWAVDYFRVIRERMFQTVDAFYGASIGDVVALRERYGADYLLVRQGAAKRRWPGMEPFTSEVRRLRSSVDVPATEQLPRQCVTWRGRRHELYDLACVAAEESQ
jgi:hypothetical protein